MSTKFWLLRNAPGQAPFVARCLNGESAQESLAPCERDILIGHNLSLSYRFPRELLPGWRALEAAVLATANRYLRTTDTAAIPASEAPLKLTGTSLRVSVTLCERLQIDVEDGHREIVIAVVLVLENNPQELIADINLSRIVLARSRLHLQVGDSERCA